MMRIGINRHLCKANQLQEIYMAEGFAGFSLVKLQSSEGETFEVAVEVVRVSRTLSVMLEGKQLVVCVLISLVYNSHRFGAST